MRCSCGRSTPSRTFWTNSRNWSASSAGKPEHLGDHADGDVLGVLGGRVDHVVPGDRVEQLVAVGAGERLERGDGLGGEGRQQQAAGIVVERRVRGDRRGDADGSLGQRPPLVDDDAPGGEVLGVVGDGRDVVVAGRQPHAAVAIGVGDRAGHAQLVPDRERVGGPGLVGVVEVGGPVGDGRVVTAHRSTLPSRSWSASIVARNDRALGPGPIGCGGRLDQRNVRSISGMRERSR